MKIYLVFFLLFASASYSKPAKIGYINIDHVVTRSPQFSQANDRVIRKFKPQENDLIFLDNNIKSNINRFNKNKDNFSKSEIKQKIKKIADLERELKQKALSLKKQLAHENNQELEIIQNLINTIIREIAKEQNFDLILYQKVAYASKKVNITSLVSQKLKQQFK